MPLKVLFRTYRGDDIVRTLPIDIPANATGSLSVLVSDGARLGQAEQREARIAQPRSVDLMIKSLNKARRNNTLYVKLLGSNAGAVVNGETVVARCRRRCWASSKRIATAAPSTRCTARRSANGSCRPSTPFPARARVTITVSQN